MILTTSLIKTSLFLIPALTVQVGDALYVRQTSSAECWPLHLTRWNPMTATWIVEAGASKGDFTAFVGHKSYHAVESLKHLESYDYAGIEFKRVFK